MRKKPSNLLQHNECPIGVGKGLCTALGAAAAITAASVLVSRLVSHKDEASLPKGSSQEPKPKEVHASLLRSISHDLRTPLSGIMGNSLLYLENHDALTDEEKLKLVSHIHEDSGWLINMAENLMAISRIHDLENAINTREEIIEEVLGETLQKMETRHPGFAVHVTIPKEIILLPMDALLIEQVIINLLENALLHSGSGEPVDVIVEDGEDFATFTVRDYGRGLPQEMLDCRFSDSPAAASTASHKKPCVGLVVCKAIISAHHGSFTGRNHSRGAEFIFTLPKRSC